MGRIRMADILAKHQTTEGENTEKQVSPRHRVG